MPNTTEANTETARQRRNEKEPARSRLFSNRDVVGVRHADEVQQASDDQVLGSIVGRGMRDGALSPTGGLAQDIKAACPDVANEPQHVENVSPVWRVDVSLHEQAEDKHDGDRSHQQQTANPAPLNQM